MQATKVVVVVLLLNVAAAVVVVTCLAKHVPTVFCLSRLAFMVYVLIRRPSARYKICFLTLLLFGQVKSREKAP